MPRKAEPKMSPCMLTGDDLHMSRPCSECPWRKDAASHFPPERFRVLASTAVDMAGTMFACHKSSDDNPKACAGFILRGAAHNLSFRLACGRGDMDPRQVSDGGHELHENYRAMAVANGVSPRDPSLRNVRD